MSFLSYCCFSFFSLSEFWSIFSSLQRYLEDAQEDKTRYAKELNLYRQTDAYRAFVQKQALVNQQREGMGINAKTVRHYCICSIL